MNALTNMERHASRGDTVEAAGHIKTTSIDALNNDCILHIFSFLPLGELVKCEKVSQKWRDLSLKTLVHVKEIKMIDLMDSRDGQNSHFGDIINILQRTTKSLTDLDLSKCCILQDAHLDEIFRLVPAITSLNLDYMPNPISISTVLETLQKHNPNIKNLSIRYPGVHKGELESSLSEDER